MTKTGGLAYLIGTLDPFEAATAGGTCVLDHTHDAIFRRSPITGRREAAVAAGPSRRTGENDYLLDLAEGLAFHDGAPVTADDVAASIEAAVGAGTTKSRLLGAQLSGIVAARPIGLGSVLIETAGPRPLLDDRLALVRVVPAAYAHPGVAAGAPGTGPFRIVESGELGALLEPARGGAGAEAVRLSAHIDGDDRTDALLDGAQLAIEDPPLDRHTEILERGFRLEWTRSQNILWMMFNCGHPILADAPVRRAIMQAIDPAALSARANGGRLAAADSLLPRWHPEYASAPAHPRFSPAEARRALRAAGFADGLRLQLTVSSVTWVEHTAPLIVEQLAAVGVEAEIVVRHTSELFTDDVPAGRFELLLSSGDPSSFALDGEFILRWYLTGTWAREYCHAGGPDIDRLERLLDEARSAVDPARRRDLLAEAQRRGAEAAFVVPIGHRQQPTAWSGRLAGFRPSRTTGLSFR